MNPLGAADDFLIERSGEILVITPPRSLETMEPAVLDETAEILLAPLQDELTPLLVVDLRRVDFFGSAFLSVLLRLWKAATVKAGLMVLAGVSSRARELLRVTSLDMIWPIYADRDEAVSALQAD